ncbi:MAG: ChbG/HpnK family deacetylase [Acidobacteria bacterium]|nr:ChbG/HpnK family deacetylase [Acidobacteriota bacterium]
MAVSNKVLLVNADDFGFTRDVNEGIVEAHSNGILTSTTLMANGNAFEHAIELAKDTPELDIGCHLVLVGGNSVVQPSRPLPKDVKGLLTELVKGRIDVEGELDAQIRRIVDAGIQPSHLDTHKHTHLLPAVLRVVARLSAKYGIRWVRRPFDYPMHAGEAPLKRRLLGRTLGFLRPYFHNTLAAHGCRTTDHFAGFSITGYLRTNELVGLLEQLPMGSTEFMTHPGFCTEELRKARTRLKESRAEELRALTAPETRQAVQRLGIELGSYRRL